MTSTFLSELLLIILPILFLLIITTIAYFVIRAKEKKLLRKIPSNFSEIIKLEKERCKEVEHEKEIRFKNWERRRLSSDTQNGISRDEKDNPTKQIERTDLRRISIQGMDDFSNNKPKKRNKVIKRRIRRR